MPVATDESILIDTSTVSNSHQIDIFEGNCLPMSIDTPSGQKNCDSLSIPSSTHPLDFQIEEEEPQLCTPVAQLFTIESSDFENSDVVEHTTINRVDSSSHAGLMTQSESHAHVEIANSSNLRFQQHDVLESRAETIFEPIASCSTTLIAPTSIVHVAQSSANHSFLNVSEDDWRHQTTDRSDNSKKMNMWAKNKFGAWRVYMGFSTDVSFENIDLKECGILLSRFFCMVCKSSGELYPTGSLMSMLMAFQRLICKEQERRINESGIVETTFDIRKHPFFGSCRRGLQSALEASRNAGVNKKKEESRCYYLGARENYT